MKFDMALNSNACNLLLGMIVERIVVSPPLARAFLNYFCLTHLHTTRASSILLRSVLDRQREAWRGTIDTTPLPNLVIWRLEKGNLIHLKLHGHLMRQYETAFLCYAISSVMLFPAP